MISCTVSDIFSNLPAEDSLLNSKPIKPLIKLGERNNTNKINNYKLSSHFKNPNNFEDCDIQPRVINFSLSDGKEQITTIKCEDTDGGKTNFVIFGR